MVNITVLMENTCVREGLHAEHGLCLWIETPHHTVLADTGASDLTWENARVLGKDLSRVDTIVISHGHYDHAGGLMRVSACCPAAAIYIREAAFGSFWHGERYIGMDARIADLPGLHRVREEACELDGELSLFAGVNGRELWPRGNRELTEQIGGRHVQDTFAHEQCLVIREGGKTVLVSGCAHSGILNILHRFTELYHTAPDYVLSGFHMMKKTEYTPDEISDMEKTAAILLRFPTVFYTGHCTGETAFDVMNKVMGDHLRPMHTGDEIRI